MPHFNIPLQTPPSSVLETAVVLYAPVSSVLERFACCQFKIPVYNFCPSFPGPAYFYVQPFSQLLMHSLIKKNNNNNTN